MRTANGASAVAVMLGLSLCGIAMAICVAPFGNPATSTEGPGCTAFVANGCANYTSCPGNDTCNAVGCGWTTCVTNGAVSLSCQAWTGGTVNTTTLCCEAGTNAGPNNVMVTVSFLKAGPTSCGGCMPPGGGED